MELRDILIYFSVKYNGRFEDIYDAIKRKEQVSEEEVNNIKSKIRSGVITIIDKDYPSCLTTIYHPPFVLYYYGKKELLYHPLKLGVVGTRSPSPYGIEITRNILKGVLEKEDICIVSGMALGIDSIAHEMALSQSRGTIGVLASGIDECYLKSKLSLYLEIKEKGLLISEYPFSSPAEKKNFGVRNRIIAALSDNLLVPEANQKSGTSITVKHALEANRNIMCVPTYAFEDSLPNRLIQEGAKMILNEEDVLDEIKS